LVSVIFWYLSKLGEKTTQGNMKMEKRPIPV